MEIFGLDSDDARSAMNTAFATTAIGTLQLGVAVSLAALIFAGPLAAGAGRASLGFILGTAIVSGLLGLRSSMNTVIAGAQDTAAIVTAAVAASIAASTAPDQQVATVIVTIALSCALTGVAMWLAGQYGFGSIVRFLPYPVISGFMAGTGWLLFRGGFEVMRNAPLTLGSLGELFTWSESKLLLVGLLLGVFMMVCDIRKLGGTAIGLAILATAIGVHLVGRTMASLETLERDGWLIGPFPEGGGWAPIRPSDLSAADWGSIASNSTAILAIVVVSVVGIMLNLSGLEDVIDAEIEVDREVRISGLANIAASVGGGMIGYHLLGSTTLARQMGVRSRLVTMLIAALAAATFAFGYDLVALVPRAVAGGVLVGLGLTLLVRWARTLTHRMSRADRILSALILAIIALVGILTGVAMGLLAAAAIFVFRYSQIDPVRHTIDAAGRSNVDRRAADRDALALHRGRIIAVEAQGYLFFGSITQLRRSITEALEPPPTETQDRLGSLDGLRYVIIDFSRVSGIDSTAAAGMRALTNRLTEQDVVPVWSAINDEIAAEFKTNQVEFLNIEPDLYHAIAWAEDQVLAATPNIAGAKQTTVVAYPPAIAASLEKRSVRAGETVIHVDDTDRDLYFVDEGLLGAWTTLTDGRDGRLRQISAGAVIGEVAFITGEKRTATVVADTDATLHVLTRERFDELLRDDPSTASALQSFLLNRLADRLSSTSALVSDLMG